MCLKVIQLILWFFRSISMRFQIPNFISVQRLKESTDVLSCSCVNRMCKWALSRAMSHVKLVWLYYFPIVTTGNHLKYFGGIGSCTKCKSVICLNYTYLRLLYQNCQKWGQRWNLYFCASSDSVVLRQKYSISILYERGPKLQFFRKSFFTCFASVLNLLSARHIK